MEGPGRLVTGIGVTLGLAALSVYLLTQPSALPASLTGAQPAATGIGPAVLAAFGRDFGNLFSSAFGAINVGLLYGLLHVLGIDRTARLWLAVAFGFGTAHWWVAASGGPEGLAHAVAVTFGLLALLIALSGRWPLLCGLLLGAAAVARLPVVLAYPLLLALYLARPAGSGGAGEATPARGGAVETRPVEQVVLASVLGSGVLLPLVLLGYTWLGPLDLDNVPRQLHAAFLRSVDLVPEAPWFRPNWTAASLLLTTPLYLWLARARSAAPAVRWGWVAVALIVVATVLSGPVGAPQFGYRPSLDAAPFLFLLLGWVFRDGISTAARVAVLLGVAVSTYGMVTVGILEPPFAGF